MHTHRHRVSVLLASFLGALCLCAPPGLGQGSSRKKADSERLAIDPPAQAGAAAETELPNAVTAETARLTFHVSPLSTKGLLLEQTRGALKSVSELARGGRTIKLRAFVAGTADARRVRAIVTEFFVSKKQPLPALTTVEAGALGQDGAQVVIESVLEQSGKRLANPDGVVFFAAQPAADAAQALQTLAASAAHAEVAASAMLRVTCFVDSDASNPSVQASAAQLFPSAGVDFVQTLRAASGSKAACEGVARGKGRPGSRLVFTGGQMAFGGAASDLRLAFERLGKTLQASGATYRDVVFSSFYPAGQTTAQQLSALSQEFFSRGVPASTTVFEGLASPDASLSMEVVAAIQTAAAPQ